MKMVYLLFKGHKGFHLLHIFLAAILFLLLLLMLLNILQSRIELQATSAFKDKNLYQLADNLFNDKERLFFQQQDSYSILKDFGDRLKTEPRFQYAVVNWQPVHVVDFKGNEIFEAYYELGQSQDSQTYRGATYRNIKSLQMNQGSFDVFQIRISSGHGFQDSDYTYDGSKETIPLILGAELESYYELGDTISLMLYNESFTGEVIGFTAPSQVVVSARSQETLIDRYIIMPALQFDKITPDLLRSHEDTPFIRASLFSSINGFVFTAAQPQEVQRIMDAISNEVKFYDYSIIGADGGVLGVLIQLTDQNRNLLYVTVAVAFVLILLLYLWTIAIHIRYSQKTYAVLLISGYHLQNVPRIVVVQLVIMMLLGSVLPMLLLLLVWQQAWILLLAYILSVLLVVGILAGITLLCTRRVLARIDMIQQLKG